MQVEWKHFPDFSPAELYEVLKLRFDVFVLEQESIYSELDNRDQTALHMLVRKDQGARLAAYLRILRTADSMIIGRVVIHPDHRGGGFGQTIMQEALAKLTDVAPGMPIGLSAQHHLESFYGRLGFRQTSDIYDDGGIPHIDMIIEGQAS